MNPPEYAVQIIWSREDGAFIAATFELPGCIADGQTPEEALAHLKVIIKEWIEVANEEGRPIPPPVSREDIDKLRESLQAKEEQKMREQIEAPLGLLANAQSLTPRLKNLPCKTRPPDP